MLHHCGNELLFSRIGTGYCIDCKVGVVLGADDSRWWERANCRGLNADLFFPRRGDDVHQATAVCQSCAVKAECLDYAMDNGERFGIWGGLTGKQRRVLRRERPTRRSCPICSTRFADTGSGASTYCGDECRKSARAATVAKSARRRRAG